MTTVGSDYCIVVWCRDKRNSDALFGLTVCARSLFDATDRATKTKTTDDWLRHRTAQRRNSRQLDVTCEVVNWPLMTSLSACDWLVCCKYLLAMDRVESSSKITQPTCIITYSSPLPDLEHFYHWSTLPVDKWFNPLSSLRAIFCFCQSFKCTCSRAWLSCSWSRPSCPWLLSRMESLTLPYCLISKIFCFVYLNLI